MKNLQLSILLLISNFFSSCSDRKTQSQQVTKTITTVVSEQNTLLMSDQKKDTIKYSYSYSYSNDTICQLLFINTLNKSKKYDGIPENFEFKLVLKNKLENTQTEINGIASLTSPNESFSDENEPDAGTYFAADYNKNNTGFIINIALDIENYEACAVSIKSDKENSLANYINSLNKYPLVQVLKRVDSN